MEEEERQKSQLTYSTRHFLDIQVGTRLLYPQHLDGIWTGPLQFMLPYDTLSEYPEPWFWKIPWSDSERTY